MTQHAHLDPSAFFLEGGKTGVLLIHGCTGSPTEMRWIGDYPHAPRVSVSGPLLPGHGTTPEAMNCCRWTDWTGHVEATLADLRARCTRVFVGGLSMGSLLTLHLAAKFSDLPGAIVYSPAVWTTTSKVYLTPIARHFVAFQPKSADSDLMDPQANRQLWCYAVDPVGAAAELLKLILDVRRSLPRSFCPVIIIHAPAIQPSTCRTQRAFSGSAHRTSS